MSVRTDLAIEIREQNGQDTDGVTFNEEHYGSVKLTSLEIKTQAASDKLGKSTGKYITVEVPPFSDGVPADDSVISVIKKQILTMLPENDGTVLIIGLGNTAITPDAFGPKVASKILATRHITDELARSIGFEKMRSVCVVAPGVLGQTGIETAEMLSGIADKIKPICVIAVDALASRSLSRLGCTIQISDAGISPGAGVGNRRITISKETLGIPVISIGVPTVVDALTLASDLTGNECMDTVEPGCAKMIVTPQEIDLIVDRASQAVAHSINCALQPHLSHKLLLELV